MTERKKELLALLPIEVQKSRELTTSAKLILANIVQWYGTDYARENQLCYRTNKEMMKDTQIKSENSIISGATLLQQKGLISPEFDIRKLLYKLWEWNIFRNFIVENQIITTKHPLP